MIYLAVIGPSECSEGEAEAAFKVGAMIASRGAVLVCGGGGGVMDAASRGARSENGTVIGILPGESNSTGNPNLSYAIATGLGEARNAIITRTADAVIAVGGGYGTLSEIALAMKMAKPVVLLDSWRLHPVRPPGRCPITVTSAVEAVELAFRSVKP